MMSVVANGASIGSVLSALITVVSIVGNGASIGSILSALITALVDSEILRAHRGDFRISLVNTLNNYLLGVPRACFMAMVSVPAPVAFTLGVWVKQ